MDIPPDLGLPLVCPYDNEPWERYDSRIVIELVTVTLCCPHCHVSGATLTSEEFLSFRLGVEPEKLLGELPLEDED